MKSLKVVLDFTETSPSVWVGEPPDYKTVEHKLPNGEIQLRYNGNLHKVGSLGTTIFKLLEALENRTYALLYVSERHYTKIMQRILEAQKIVWCYRPKTSWLSRDKPIRKRTDIHKKIQLTKRLVKEYQNSVTDIK